MYLIRRDFRILMYTTQFPVKEIKIEKLVSDTRVLLVTYGLLTKLVSPPMYVLRTLY